MWDEAFEPPDKNPADSRPLLVIPDSKGRVRRWHSLRKSGYWREVIALCSNSTPRTYLDYLKKRHIDCIIAGDYHVDFKKWSDTI